MGPKQIFIGIDVSKNQLDAAIRPGTDFFTVSNDDQGITDLVRRLADFNPRLILLEASGGYEILAAASLRQTGLPAKSSAPARFGNLPGPPVGWPRLIRSMPPSWPNLPNCCNRPRPWPEALQQELAALMTRRRQL
jgi:transposase